MITADTDVQELVAVHPEILSYLMQIGLCGLNCGDPEAGTIALIAKEKGFTNKQLDEIIAQLNRLTIETSSKTRLIDKRDEFRSEKKW